MRPAAARSFGRGLQGVLSAALGFVFLVAGSLSGLFPYGIHKGGEFIAAGSARLSVQVQADQFPAPRSGEAAGMGCAQIVTMRFGVGGQRSQDGCGIRVYVGQGSYCRLAAG